MGKIIWIASYPKSGNTWTRAFLLHLFMNPREPFPLDEMGMMSPVDAGLHWFNEALGEERTRYTPEAAAALRVAAQREIAKCFPATGFVKTHCCFLPWFGHPMFDLSLTAGAIYVVRNPLDIVASYASHVGRSLDDLVRVITTENHEVPGSEKQTPQLLGSWSQNVLSWTKRPHPGLHVMRYEDMVAAPAVTFGKLARFLGVDPPVERLERAIDFSSFDQLKQIEAAKGFAERTEHQSTFFRSGRIGGWREELTPEQVRRVVAANREQMARFDYLPDGI